MKNIRGVLKWSLLIGFIGFVTTGGIALGYVSALVKDEEVRSRETILKEMQQNSETGYVYFRDESVVGQLRTEEDRRLIKYADIPPLMEKAVLATEDAGFYNHIGIDISSLARAMSERVFNQDVQTGGSTITQQVARRVFLSLEKTDSRKVKEIFLSLRLERYMTKQEILAAYLNKIPFGNSSAGYNIYGIKMAARGIFNKELNELNLAQIAYLAGLPQQPSRFSAFTGKGEFDPEGFQLAKERQELVLLRMLKVDSVTKQEYEEAMAFDLKESFAKSQLKAYTTYPHLMLEAERKAAELLLRLKNPTLSEQAMQTDEYEEALKDARELLLRGGYKIYTTIDKTAYDAMHRITDNPKMFTKDHEKKGVEQVGGILIDNKTSEILGMIEGRDFYVEQLNHATQMRRQPGSAMKPIAAYLPALESGVIQPASIVDDVPMILPDGGKGVHIPRNWDGQYHGLMTARQALNQSWNIPALKLFLDVVTIPKAWEFAKSIGITSLTSDDNSARTGVIGGLEYGVSVEELTNAYATIANQGVYQDAYFIHKITDLNDKIIYQHKSAAKQVFSEQTAYLMTDMLRTVITEGTAAEVERRFKYKQKVPIAGKTGTTSENFDFWFVGYSPDVTLGVWIGYGQPSKLLEPNRAKRVWADVMNELVKTKPNMFITPAFEQPSGIVSKTVSTVSGLLPSDLALREKLVVTDVFNRLYLPTKQDDSLKTMDLVIVNGRTYLPQAQTPRDMIRNKRVVKRTEPIADLMKRIDEAKKQLDPEKLKEIKSFVPTDGYADYPTEVDPRVEDGRDPLAPPKITLVKGEKTVKIMFSSSLDSDVAGYRLFRSTEGGPFQPVERKKVLAGDSLFFTDEIASNRSYGYYVVAVDIAGRTSSPSQSVYTNGVTTSAKNTDDLPKTDVEQKPTTSIAATLPTPPTQLVAKGTDLGIEFTWIMNPQNQNITAYHVYFSQTQEGPYKRIGSTTSGQFTYISVALEGWYRVSAENKAGVSKPSTSILFKP
jgi:penicillin-binding protein